MFNRNRSLVLTAALAATPILQGCGGSDEEPEAVLRPVRSQQVFSTGGSRTRTFSGTARSGVESRLSFKVPGTLRRIPVSVGQSVGSGDLIAELDPDDYRVEVQRAEAALLQARAEERRARAIIEAAQRRLRPILLTTATTMGGLTPLWLGGGPMWEPMAISIIFGLAFATVLTLGLVPVLYSALFKVSFKNFSYTK